MPLFHDGIDQTTTMHARGVSLWLPWPVSESLTCPFRFLIHLPKVWALLITLVISSHWFHSGIPHPISNCESLKLSSQFQYRIQTTIALSQIRHKIDYFLEQGHHMSHNGWLEHLKNVDVAWKQIQHWQACKVPNLTRFPVAMDLIIAHL